MEGNGNPENFGIERGQIIPPWMPSLYLGGPSGKGSKPTAWADKEEHRRYDGHMGPFDPNRNAQLCSPGKEWRALIVSPAA